MHVSAHEAALTAWHQALEDYQHQVTTWREDTNIWFYDAEQWHEEYLGFLGFLECLIV